MLNIFHRPLARRALKWAKRLLLAGVLLAILAAGLGIAALLYLDSPQFQERARQFIEQTIRDNTGAAVSLKRLDWDLFRQRFVLEDLTIRGLEPATGPPLAHIERIRAGIHLRSLIDRRIDLFELTIEKPQLVLTVDPQGKTNLPNLPAFRQQTDFRISIDAFKVADGLATINDQPLRMNFALTKVNADMIYRGATRVLSGQIRYDGVIKHEDAAAIAYNLAGAFDYTTGTVLVQGIELRSGASTVKVQGRIDRVLTEDIAGQLEYTGTADSALIAAIFSDAHFAGKADTSGRLEFTSAGFVAKGGVKTAEIGFEGGTVRNVSSQYEYRYPERLLALTALQGEAFGGAAAGSLTVEDVPGLARAKVDLSFRDIDAASLSGFYPWDPQYRVYSKVTGALAGSFEEFGKRFQFSGTATLKSYPPMPVPGVVALPIDGESGFELQPGKAVIRNGRARFFATEVLAEGMIDDQRAVPAGHPTMDLKVKLTSSDLRNLFFLYRDANGSGTFDGRLSGPIQTPRADGTFEAAGLKHAGWTIERAAGGVQFDMMTQAAELRDVRVTEGSSVVTVNGKVNIADGALDLRLESPRLEAQDAARFDSRIAEHVAGTFAGTARLTSLDPLRVEGDVQARDLVIDKQPVGEVRAHVRFADPLAEVTAMTVTRGSATAAGDATYDLGTKRATFTIDARNIDLETLRSLGVPPSLSGTVDRGRFSGSGTLEKFAIEGKEVAFREDRGATLNGDFAYDSGAETMNFNLNVAALSFQLLRDIGNETGHDFMRDLGAPASLVAGITVQSGRFTGQGPIAKPVVSGRSVEVRHRGGAAAAGSFDYDAGTERLGIDMKLTSPLEVDAVRDLARELGLPASFPSGIVIEQGGLSSVPNNGAARQQIVTATGLTIRQKGGAVVTGKGTYNTDSKELSYDLNLVSALEIDSARDLVRELGAPASLPAGIVIERGAFSGKSTAREQIISGTGVSIRQKGGAAATGILAYNSGTEAFNFDMNLTAALEVDAVRDLVRDLGAPASLPTGIVVERGRFTGSGTTRQPVFSGKGISIRESHGAVLTGSLDYNSATEALSFDVTAAPFDLSAIRDLGIPADLAGRIENAHFSGSGKRSQPNIEGSAALRNLTFFGEEFPNARITIPRSSGSDVTVRFEAGSIDLTAQIDLATPGFPFVGSGSFTRYPLEKLAGLRGESVTVTGRADRLEGSLTDLGRLRGRGQIESAEMRVEGRELKSTRAFGFEFNPDQITFTGLTVDGEATLLNVAGVVRFRPKDNLDLTVTGTLNLALLAPTSDVTLSGALDLVGRIAGSLQDRDLFGTATFRNAGIGVKSLAVNISGINGRMRFDENNVTIENISATMGGGTIQLQGAAVMGSNDIESLNVFGQVNGVRITYPEDLRSVLDGRLALSGPWVSPLLEGSLQIRTMSYNSEFEKFLALVSGPGGLGSSASPMGRLRLALHVEGDRNISIKNELAEAEARVSLDIRGTVENPAVTGHVEASGGTLTFQGQRYEIRRGNIDFVDPIRIDPIVDIQAEADLRSYRVILGITGHGDRLRFDMRSDPPLPDLEIVSLIAGGRTRRELLEGKTSENKTSEQLFQGGAASILFDLLKSRVSDRLGLGLNRFRLEPLPAGSEKNALARVTVPVQVTKDLSITYSQDVSSSAQPVIQIEYFVSKNVSILATRDETAFALDIKRRQRF